MMGGRWESGAGTSDTINAASSFSQRFLGEASSSTMLVSLQLPRRPRELVSGRRIGRSIS